MIKKTYIQNIAKCAMAAVAAVSVASCSDSYPGLEYSGNNSVISNEESYDKTPIMVFINPQNFFSITATKSSGTGPFEGLDEKYAKSKFYIFAFRGTKDEQDHGSLSYEPDLSKTRFANGHTHDENADDCLVDGTDYDFGYLAKLTLDYPGSFDFKNQVVQGDLQDKDTPGENGTLSSAQLYYSWQHQDVGYNFFAYHIDNLDETVSSNRRQNTDEIAYEVTIDGTQDIMCGFAPPVTSEVLDGLNLKMSPEERQNILNIGLYSTFAAHRGLNPVVNMKHQLTQLKFVAYPGDEESGKITIQKVSVLERTHGRLVVAHKNAHKDGSLIGYTPYDQPQEPIYLKGEAKDGNECPEFEPVKVQWQEGDDKKLVYERKKHEVGGSIMLPEADSYEVTLEFTQEGVLDNNTGLPKPFYATYNVVRPNKEIFQRGYQYTISIAVYGLEPIKVTANIAAWGNGGDVEVGEDDPANSVEIHD